MTTTSTRVSFQYPPGASLVVDMRLVNSSTFVYSGVTALTAIEVPPTGGPYAMSNYYVNVPADNNGTFEFMVRASATVVSVFQKPIGCASLTGPQVRVGSAFSGTPAFSRLFVDRLVHGKTTVTWRLAHNFTIAGPFTFWLQASYAGHINAVDWVTVSGPLVNVTQLTDATNREPAGKKILTHYRVLVSAGGKIYVSEAAQTTNKLPDRDYLIAREIVRKETLRRKFGTGIAGFLLRSFRYGEQDKNTTFSLTGDIIDTDSPSSWGTGFQIGYHPAVSMAIEQEGREGQETRGDGQPTTFSTATDELTARLVGDLDVVAEDVWVNASTDERFLVEKVNVIAAVRGVPVVQRAVMTLLPFSSPIYRIPVDGFN